MSAAVLSPVPHTAPWFDGPIRPRSAPPVAASLLLRSSSRSRSRSRSRSPGALRRHASSPSSPSSSSSPCRLPWLLDPPCAPKQQQLDDVKVPGVSIAAKPLAARGHRRTRSDSDAASAWCAAQIMAAAAVLWPATTTVRVPATNGSELKQQQGKEAAKQQEIIKKQHEPPSSDPVRADTDRASSRCPFGTPVDDMQPIPAPAPAPSPEPALGIPPPVTSSPSPVSSPSLAPSITSPTPIVAIPPRPRRGVTFPPHLGAVRFFQRHARPADVAATRWAAADEPVAPRSQYALAAPNWPASIPTAPLPAAILAPCGSGPARCRRTVEYQAAPAPPVVAPVPWARVAVESVRLMVQIDGDRETARLVGTVLVRNVAYAKDVVVRATTNAWATFTDQHAEYVGAHDAGWDRFRFVVDVSHDVETRSAANVQLCVRYTYDEPETWDADLANVAVTDVLTRTTTVWDNNGECNYELRVQRWPVPPVPGNDVVQAPASAPAMEKSLAAIAVTNAWAAAMAAPSWSFRPASAVDRRGIDGVGVLLGC